MDQKKMLEMKDSFDEIKSNLLEFWKKLAEQYSLDKWKAASLFLSNFKNAKENFRTFCKDNDLNGGTFWGILLEWTFFYIIKWAILFFWKEDKFVVKNNYSLPFKWKKKGNSKVNIDVVLKDAKTTKLFYCLELKTNFEDWFDKYYREQTEIFHHRLKAYAKFKYHYIALSSIPASVRNNSSRKLETLKKRWQLWLFPNNWGDKLLEDSLLLLESLYAPLL